MQPAKIHTHPHTGTRDKLSQVSPAHWKAGYLAATMLNLYHLYIFSRFGTTRTVVHTIKAENRDWRRAAHTHMHTPYTCIEQIIYLYWSISTKTPNVRQNIRQNYDVEFSNLFHFMPFFINSGSFSVQKLFARCRDTFFIFSSAYNAQATYWSNTHTVFFPCSWILLLASWFMALASIFTTYEFPISSSSFSMLICIWKWTNFVATFSVFVHILSLFFPSTKVFETVFFLTSISYMQP